MRAAMSAKLHDNLDRIMGCGRLLMQEMALLKPPQIGGEKPWHQDAAYFRGSDPGLMFGVWIALDPATSENGCMEVVPGSHLAGPAPHIPHEDINLCTIRPDHVRADQRVAIPLARRRPGVPQPDPSLHGREPVGSAAARATVPLPSDRSGMDVTGGASRPVSR